MKRESLGDKVFSTAIYIFLLLLGFTTFYPFWNALVISFNDGMDTALGGITFWPRTWSLENYSIVFQDSRIINAFMISVLRTIIGTILSILCTSIFAYGMTKRELIGRNFYMVMCVVTLYFGGGLIPTFLVIRGLGLMDSFWVFIIPSLVSVWNMIIFRTFFMGLPGGLEEAAKIDGCGNWSTFFRIILPLSGPVIATLSLFTAIAHWNEWFLPTIYITNEKLLPIQSMLQQILSTNISSQQLSQLDSAAQARLNSSKSFTTKSLSMATMMVATLPIIMVYPFVQKYFVKGVLVGSIKE
ncbi:carbohydrate ABC transporter permease [Paenibacillus pini]|uniref:Maltose/maltodextrin transport permease n=1 Tax=Paenibacillus pini JCM 16418 TaxID=1236976 RepID=W7YTH4_9BACL|nr:carbohydrate ABC transporter permease [Paenibacillus pini]GAF07926.1 maltose/maltodextrin transport permease [Paenibacillus pini JCM 16418]